MKKVTIDSSVIIASLLKNESRHKEASTIWQKVLTGKQVAIMPYSVLVEVVAAIKRRTGSRELAIEIKNELMSIDSLSFVILDNESAENASDIAARIGVRGMDAIVIQVAEEYQTDLISFDTEMVKKYQLISKRPE
jgi:predicted nucleic acid-binding protein